MNSLKSQTSRPNLEMYVICLLLLFSSSQYSQTVWTPMDIQGNAYGTGVFFTDEFTGYITKTTGEIVKTSNSGLNWFSLNSGTSIYLNSIYFINSNTGFVVGGNKCFRTINAGLNWDSIPVGFEPSFAKIIFVNSTVGFILINSGKILKTTNTGVNWSVSGEIVSPTDLFFTNQNIGYCCRYNQLWKTTNQGSDWYALPNSSTLFDRLFFLNETTGFSASHYTPGPPPLLAPAVLVYSTIDSGRNWTNISPPLNTVLGSVPRSIHFLTETIGYIGNARGLMTDVFFKTINGGVTWFNQLPSNVSVINSIYFINSNTGFITGSHSFKTTNGGSNVVAINPEIEVLYNYSLSQNYPNPFNPVTNIKFDIPKKMSVKITIFDILGKEISILANEEMNAGSYSVDWDASNYPSGVYFYKITAGDYSESKKMILLK